MAVPSAEELIRWLRVQGVLADVHEVPRVPNQLSHRGISVIAGGTVMVGSDVCPLEVRIPQDFPARLPRVAIDPRGPFAGAPHVGADGVICYRDADSVMVDPTRRADIVGEAVDLAVSVLRAGRSVSASVEYANEITAYWNQFDAPTYISLVEPGDSPRLIKSYRDRHGARIHVEAPADLAAFMPARQQGGQACNALYVPIDLAPGVHPKELATRHGFVDHVLPVLSLVPRQWRRFRRRCRASGLDVLLGVRRSLGRRGIIGVRVESQRPVDESLLLTLGHCTFTPFCVDPGDRAFIVPRGGASGLLADKKVLLIGCGSVGGHIALGLARNGVGRLDLVDPDLFELANTYRHVCGRAYLRMHKSDGLKREIERLLPYVVVESRRSDVLNLLAREPSLFADYDLVVSAIGAPMIERRINEAILATPSAPAGMFAWLEPLGIGAHVLTVNVAGHRAGCFDCLYQTDGRGYGCRAAFAAPDERYRRDAMGCGGQFVPFGDVDASHLAARAVGRAVDVLLGGRTGGLLSLKGRAHLFRELGFHTTKRFEEPGTELVASSEDLWRPSCTACAS